MRDINRFRNGRAQGGGRPHGNNRGVDSYGRHIREMNESRGFGDRGGRYGRPFGSRWPDEGMGDRYGSGGRYLNESWSHKEIPPIDYGRGDVVEVIPAGQVIKPILKNGDGRSKKYIKSNRLAKEMYSVNMYNFSDSDYDSFVDYMTDVFMKHGIQNTLFTDGETDNVLAEVVFELGSAGIASLNKGAINAIDYGYIRTVEDLVELMHENECELNILLIEG